jgi:hypothetical protein
MPIITCERSLSEDFLFDCDNPPLQGLTDVVALINYNDIDRVATTFDPLNSQIVTSLVLKNDKRAYRLEGYKLANSAAAELVVKDAPAVNAFLHTIGGVGVTVDAQQLKAFANMSLGAKLVAVVERKYKGANQESAFMVFGYDSGMELATATYNSNENAGTMPFTVANPADEEEPKPPLIWLDTNYGTTLTAFEALFGGY